MSVVEDTRKVLQDFLAPEMRATNAKLEGIQQHVEILDRRVSEVKSDLEKRIYELKSSIEKRFDDLSTQNVTDKAENLHMIEIMMRELGLRIDLAITKNKVAEYEARAISKEAQQ